MIVLKRAKVSNSCPIRSIALSILVESTGVHYIQSIELKICMQIKFPWQD